MVQNELLLLRRLLHQQSGQSVVKSNIRGSRFQGL